MNSQTLDESLYHVHTLRDEDVETFIKCLSPGERMETEEEQNTNREGNIKEGEASKGDANSSANKDNNSSSSTSNSQASSANPDAPQDHFSESDIQEIIGLGFSRAQAVEELRRQNGNKTQAMAALFAKSFKM